MPEVTRSSRGRPRPGPRRRAPRSRGFRRLVGALLLGAVALAVALAYLKPDPFGHQVTVRAEFTDASGIGVVGQDVRMAGVPVGKITDTALDGDHAVVTMELDSDAAPIHSDATAELRPHLAFEGTAFIDLQPGSPGAPPLGDQSIPLAQTRVYVPLDEALRVFDPHTRRSFKQDAQGLAGVVRGEGAGGIQRTLRKARGLTRTLGQATGAALGPHRTELAGAVTGLSRTSAAVATRSDAIGPLVRDADRTLGAIGTDNAAALDATLARLPQTLSDLDSGGRALDGILAQLDPLAQSLDPGLQALAPTLDAAEPLVRRAAPILTRATPLASDLRQALDTGAQGAPAARRLLAAIDPSLRLLDRSLLPALHAPTPELHLPTYVAFLNLFEGGGGASRPFQTAADGNPIQPATPGHFMRFGIRFLSGVGPPFPPCKLLSKANPGLARLASSRGVCTP